MSVSLNTARLNHTVPQAAELANASRSKLYEEIKAGRLRILKLGRKTLITNEALGDWLRALEGETQKRK